MEVLNIDSRQGKEMGTGARIRPGDLRGRMQSPARIRPGDLRGRMQSPAHIRRPDDLRERRRRLSAQSGGIFRSLLFLALSCSSNYY